MMLLQRSVPHCLSDVRHIYAFQHLCLCYAHILHTGMLYKLTWVPEHQQQTCTKKKAVQGR